MVMIQLLLPALGPDGEPLDEQVAVTRRELLAKFQGLTAYLRSPAVGAWTNPEGNVERDQVVMVEVVTDEFDRDWWRQYQVTVADRFAQREIHVRALPVEVL